MRKGWLQLTDLIGWLLVVYGPEPCINPYTSFGRWCLDHAGGWAYRDYSAI